MSRCRCDDLKRYRGMVDSLSTVQQTIATAESHVTNLNSYIYLLADNCLKAVEISDEYEMSNAIRILDNDIVSVKNRIVYKVNQKKEELQAAMPSMSYEDSCYHREEEEKRKAIEKAMAEMAEVAQKGKSR